MRQSSLRTCVAGVSTIQAVIARQTRQAPTALATQIPGDILMVHAPNANHEAVVGYLGSQVGCLFLFVLWFSLCMVNTPAASTSKEKTKAHLPQLLVCICNCSLLDSDAVGGGLNLKESLLLQLKAFGARSSPPWVRGRGGGVSHMGC